MMEKKIIYWNPNKTNQKKKKWATNTLINTSEFNPKWHNDIDPHFPMIRW